MCSMYMNEAEKFFDKVFFWKEKQARKKNVEKKEIWRDKKRTAYIYKVVATNNFDGSKQQTS